MQRPREVLMYKELIEEIKVSKVLYIKEKTIFELFHIDGLSIDEISKKLSISDSNVKARLCRPTNWQRLPVPEKSY